MEKWCAAGAHRRFNLAAVIFESDVCVFTRNAPSSGTRGGRRRPEGIRNWTSSLPAAIWALRTNYCVWLCPTAELDASFEQNCDTLIFHAILWKFPVANQCKTLKLIKIWPICKNCRKCSFILKLLIVRKIRLARAPPAMILSSTLYLNPCREIYRNWYLCAITVIIFARSKRRL
jgi:hypothetical protein